MRQYTYGQEVELGSIDRKTELPVYLSYSSAEFDIVSPGVGAIDPTGKEHTIGGEINTIPTGTIEEQVNMFKAMLQIFPNATINHRHHHHIHISWHGLREDLEAQKKLLKYFYENTKDIVDTIYVPTRHPDMNRSAWSYQIIDRDTLPDWRYKMCMEATSCKDFFESHAKVKDGRVMYQTMKRMAFNLYSIKKHGTIEMRCLFPTLDPEAVEGAFRLLTDLVNEAMSESPRPVKEAIDFSKYKLPKEVPYDNELELLWQRTNKKK